MALASFKPPSFLNTIVTQFTLSTFFSFHVYDITVLQPCPLGFFDEISPRKWGSLMYVDFSIVIGCYLNGLNAIVSGNPGLGDPCIDRYRKVRDNLLC